MAEQPKGVQMHDELTGHAPLFTAWFASWTDVRRELETMLETYEQRHPDYDRGWIEPVFEMIDTTLNNLSYRAQWLNTNLHRDQQQPTDDSDDLPQPRNGEV